MVLICFYIKQHYGEVAKKLIRLSNTLENVKGAPPDLALPLRPGGRTAVILVGGFGGLGVHTVQTILKTFPGIYTNMIFVSVGVVDSGGFKGEEAVSTLKAETEKMLGNYVLLASRLGLASTYRAGIGTDVVEEAEKLCYAVAREFPLSTFFTGKIIFEKDLWLNRLLHNETGLTLQKRLQLAGHTMVVLPAKVS